MSTYREGRLARGAVESLLEAGVDELLVYEGPAGERYEDEDEMPPTDLGPHAGELTFRGGRWRTDGRKRDAMLQDVRRRLDEPVWGVWLDGDEVLVNGRYLRDQLQAVVWNDEHDGSDVPTIHWPLRIVEVDGTISITTSRLFRADLVQSIDVSSATVTNHLGIEEGWGNKEENGHLWVEMWLQAIDAKRMMAWPPLPCEPHIYHRSHLRHPARRGLRLHAQETAILREQGKL